METFSATVRLGAGVRTLTIGETTWDLQGLDRGKTAALASMLSDAKGLTNTGTVKSRRARNRSHVGASQIHG
jgi:hypothetical protein